MARALASQPSAIEGERNGSPPPQAAGKSEDRRELPKMRWGRGSPHFILGKFIILLELLISQGCRGWPRRPVNGVTAHSRAWENRRRIEELRAPPDPSGNREKTGPSTGMHGVVQFFRNLLQINHLPISFCTKASPKGIFLQSELAFFAPKHTHQRRTTKASCLALARTERL